jgi:lipopolysaccharide exporter
LKFNKDSYWIKTGAFSLLQNLTSLIFGFGGFYFLVRVLDKNQMGGWVLFVTVTSMLEVARVGFIKFGFIKFRAEENEENQGKLFTAALVLNIIFALIVSSGMLLFGEKLSDMWSTPELTSMFNLYAITSIVLVPFFQFEYLQHALLDFKGVFIIYFIRNGSLFFGILLSYLGFYQLDLFLLATINLSAAILASIICYAMVNKPLTLSSFDKNWIWKLIHFGKYVAATNIVSTLYGAIDQFMLGSLVSTASVAIFNAASRITNLINVPSMSLSAIVFPYSARLINTEGKNGIKTLYEKSVGAILAIVFPGVVFVLLFPELVITIIAGKSYLDSVEILRITIFLSFLLPFAYQFGVTLISIGYPSLNFYFMGTFFVTNLILNYFLISSYGIVGAAYGTLSTTVISFISMQIILRVMLRVSIFSVFRNMFGFYVSGFKTVMSWI